jgi:hypothetical protein
MPPIYEPHSIPILVCVCRETQTQSPRLHSQRHRNHPQPEYKAHTRFCLSTMSLPVWVVRMNARRIWQSIRKRGTSCRISSSTVCFPSSVPAKLLNVSQMYHQTHSRTKSDNKRDSQLLKREIRWIMPIAFFVPTMLFTILIHHFCVLRDRLKRHDWL